MAAVMTLSAADVRRLREKISELRGIVKIRWARACRYDKIPSDSTFVVFSEDNPYESAYNDAMHELQTALTELRGIVEGAAQ